MNLSVVTLSRAGYPQSKSVDNAPQLLMSISG